MDAVGRPRVNAKPLGGLKVPVDSEGCDSGH
jgi:hypothetical protein